MTKKKTYRKYKTTKGFMRAWAKEHEKELLERFERFLQDNHIEATSLDSREKVLKDFVEGAYEKLEEIKQERRESRRQSPTTKAETRVDDAQKAVDEAKKRLSKLKTKKKKEEARKDLRKARKRLQRAKEALKKEKRKKWGYEKDVELALRRASRSGKFADPEVNYGQNVEQTLIDAGAKEDFDEALRKAWERHFPNVEFPGVDYRAFKVADEDSANGGQVCYYEVNGVRLVKIVFTWSPADAEVISL